MNRRNLLVVGIAVVVVTAVGAVGFPMLDSPTNEAPDTNDSPGKQAPYFVYKGENLTVQSAAEQPIRGKTNLSAGEKVSIRVRSSSSENPFIKSSTATVSENGTFQTTFDFSDIPAKTEFTVSVRHNGSELMSTEGVVMK